MKEIKRLNAIDIANKFGLSVENENFIFKARETVPSYHLEPHRSEMYGLGIVENGEAIFEVNLDTYSINTPGIVAIGPDQVRQWGIKDAPIIISSLFFSEDFVTEGLSNVQFLKDFMFFSANGAHFIPLNHEDILIIQSIFNQIEQKLDSRFSKKMKSIQSLLRTLLYEIERVYETQIPNHHQSHSQAHHITEEFKGILSKNFTKHRAVEFYADELCVTPKHLSQTLKGQIGKTASELISDIVCLEAKVLLQEKKLTIAEVSDYLNFANQSFFGQYFKRKTGISPKQYKESMK